MMRLFKTLLFLGVGLQIVESFSSCTLKSPQRLLSCPSSLGKSHSERSSRLFAEEPKKEDSSEERGPSSEQENAVNTQIPVEEKSGFDKFLTTLGYKKEEGESEESLKDKIKSAGLAGAISYGAFELLFWTVSIPLAIVAYKQATGEWPDLGSDEGKLKVFELSAGFLTFARLAVPFRIATALALTPTVDKYIVKGFLKKEEEEA
mmetsp:Transcript_10121/g.13253  ORF Transcript_10121/g.13253 Transcript_10121/m.13253 type:complete len:205 (+) Transcript_10121:65-679(+)